ncbi:MAG: hypothetical protein JF585_05955 [Burkholderiales bacterium]|nr:hypothetical protein [Burkholderiales bacterium]
MTTVPSPDGAHRPLAAAVAKARAKAVSQSDRQISLAHKAQTPATPAGAAGKPVHGTQLSFGEQALHALQSTGEFVGGALLAGAQDLGQAACYTVKAVGNGVAEAAKGLESGIVEGFKDAGSGFDDTVRAIGHGIVHAEDAASDVWGLATQGASVATNLVSTLGADAQLAVTDLGTAATDIGVGAKAVLSGVGSVASSAANYGSYVVKQGGKVLNELT